MTDWPSSRRASAWPAVLALLAAVLAPTACVLWFASAAMRNERLAVRQRLTDVYRRQIEASAARLDEHWREVESRLEAAGKLPPPQAFERLAASGQVDGAVILDANGGVVYPAAAPAPSEAEGPQRIFAWGESPSGEQDSNDIRQAAAGGRDAGHTPGFGVGASGRRIQ